MSETLVIGLSRQQVEKLLKGEEVGKRPYDFQESYNSGETRYSGTVRVFVKMLSEEDVKNEPEEAFTW